MKKLLLFALVVFALYSCNNSSPEVEKQEIKRIDYKSEKFMFEVGFMKEPVVLQEFSAELPMFSIGFDGGDLSERLVVMGIPDIGHSSNEKKLVILNSVLDETTKQFSLVDLKKNESENGKLIEIIYNAVSKPDNLIYDGKLVMINNVLYHLISVQREKDENITNTFFDSFNIVVPSQFEFNGIKFEVAFADIPMKEETTFEDNWFNVTSYNEHKRYQQLYIREIEDTYNLERIQKGEKQRGGIYHDTIVNINGYDILRNSIAPGSPDDYMPYSYGNFLITEGMLFGMYMVQDDEPIPQNEVDEYFNSFKIIK